MTAKTAAMIVNAQYVIRNLRTQADLPPPSVRNRAQESEMSENGSLVIVAALMPTPIDTPIRTIPTTT